MQLALLQLEDPAGAALRLLRHVASGLLDEQARSEGPAVAERASDLARGLEELFDYTDERSRLEAWQVSVIGAQVLRREGLSDYLASNSDELYHRFVLTTAPLFDVPPGYSTRLERAQPYPVLDWLHGVLAELAAGELGDEEFGQVLEALWQQFADGMKALEQDDDPFRATRGQQACRELLASLQEMDGFIDSGDPGRLAVGMERLLVAFESLEEVFLDGMMRTLESGPTRAPVVDWLLHATLAHADGLVPLSCLEQAMAWARRLVAESAFRFELQCLGGAPGEVERQVAATWKGIEQVLAALRELERAPSSETACDSALRLLRAGGQNLQDSIELYSWLGSPAGKVPCPRCGSANRPTARVCDKCAASLPRRYARQDAAGEQAEFMRRVLGRCEDVLAGGVADQSFGSVLRAAYRRIQWAEQVLGRFPERGSMSEAVETVRERLELGLREYEQALEALNEYLAEGRLAQLSIGIRGFMAAGKTLEQVRDPKA